MFFPISRATAASALAASVVGVIWASSSAATPFAADVVHYEPGAARPAYANAEPALGGPAMWTGNLTFDANQDDTVLTPFNPPFEPDDLASIGEGGSLTLRLGRTAATGAGPTIGVHVGFGLMDIAFPTGVTGTPAGSFNSPRSAYVSVGFEEASFVDLDAVPGGAVDPFTFSIPSNYFTDHFDTPSSQTATGATLADVTKPFEGTLSDFGGKDYGQILSLLDGSAGGTWLDLSGVALPGVNYIRFQTPNPGQELFLDFVVVGGTPVPEPGAGMLLLAMAAFVGRRQRR